VVDLGQLLLQMSEGSLVVQGGVLPDIVVVVEIAQSLVQEVLLTVNVCRSGDVELIVIGAV
jgi:hypothetical protein